MHTLVSLFKKFDRLEIPLIQRDYAQGRDTAREVRVSFIRALKDALVAHNSNPNETLDLDFIYGSCSDEAEDKTFSILDGQQRLTALFLLHWYAAIRDDKMKEFRNIALRHGKHSGFRYDTRQSSMDFFDCLIKEDFDYDPLKDNQPPLSKAIKNHNWFFLRWMKDPTISSCLVVLDLIEKEFQGLDFPIYDILVDVDNPPITFQFLPLEKFSLSDELYIKMNGRGKPLTSFENFKAWLIGQIKDQDLQDLYDEYKNKLDQNWTDVFWDLSDGDIKGFDDLFLNFFRIVALYDTVRDGSSKGVDHGWLSVLLSNSNELPFDKFKKFNSFNKASLQAAKNLLDFCAVNTMPDFTELFKEAVSRREYVPLVRLYARYLFLDEIGTPKLTKETLIQFQKWCRVSDNLVHNVRIDGHHSLSSAIKATHSLKDIFDDIYGGLASLEISNISFFTKEQVSEEILKAYLIVEDEKWENRFIEIEKHEYLKGKIGSVISYSSDENGDIDVTLFEDISKKVKNLLSRSILTSSEFLLQRALLSIDDYMIGQIGQSPRFSFGNSANGSYRERNDNWLRVISKPIFRKLLKKLEDGSENELRELIKNSAAKDWRQLIVKFPKAIEYCGNRFIHRDADGNIYLMTKTMLSGYHAELWTYTLYLWLEQVDEKELPDGLKCQRYNAVYSGGDLPGVIVEFKGRSYHIIRLENSFSVHTVDGEVIDNKTLPQDIKTYFQKFNEEVFS